MSFDLAAWETSFTSAVSAAFGERIVCAGLQGSRARDEARPDSDIDAVLILDRLTGNDLSICRKLYHSLPDSELVCGFVSGKKELAHWDAGELVSFYFDTQPLIGNLEFIRPFVTPQAARRAVHSGACGIYHACCHGFVFGDEAVYLRDLYKAAFFVLRVKYFAQFNVFVKKSVDLLPLLDMADSEIIRLHMAFSSDKFDRSDLLQITNILLNWSSNLIESFHA